MFRKQITTGVGRLVCGHSAYFLRCNTLVGISWEGSPGMSTGLINLVQFILVPVKCSRYTIKAGKSPLLVYIDVLQQIHTLLALGNLYVEQEWEVRLRVRFLIVNP